MEERSNAAVLKTVDCHRSGGSNPSLSDEMGQTVIISVCLYLSKKKLYALLCLRFTKYNHTVTGPGVLQLDARGRIPLSPLKGVIVRLFLFGLILLRR